MQKLNKVNVANPIARLAVLALLFPLAASSLAFEGQPRVAANKDQVCLLGISAAANAGKEGGELKCWGSNGSPIAVPPLKRPMAVAAGNRLGGTYGGYTCAVDDGALKCWGKQDLADAIELYFHDLKALVSISAGPNDICAVDGKQGIRCYGGDVPWTHIAATVPTVTKARAVAVGAFYACALDSQNQINCWGAPRAEYWPMVAPELQKAMAQMQEKLIHPPTDLKNPSSLSVGIGQACVIDEWKPRCWGGEMSGELTFPSDSPPVSQVDAGPFRTCMILINGTVQCFGEKAPEFITESRGDYPVWIISEKDDFLARNRLCLLDVKGIHCDGPAKFEIEHGLSLNHPFSVEFPKALADELTSRHSIFTFGKPPSWMKLPIR